MKAFFPKPNLKVDGRVHALNGRRVQKPDIVIVETVETAALNEHDGNVVIVLALRKVGGLVLVGAQVGDSADRPLRRGHRVEVGRVELH